MAANLTRQLAARGALGQLVLPVRCLSAASPAARARELSLPSCSCVVTAAPLRWSAAGLTAGSLTQPASLLGSWNPAPSPRDSIFQLQPRQRVRTAVTPSSAPQFSTSRLATAAKTSEGGPSPRAASAASPAGSPPKPKAASPAPKAAKAAAQRATVRGPKAAAAPPASKPKPKAAAAPAKAKTKPPTKDQREKAKLREAVRKVKAAATRERLRARARKAAERNAAAEAKAQLKARLEAKKARRIPRAPSAYNLFVRDNYTTVRATITTPGREGQRQAFSAVAQRFRGLPASEKQRYEESAAELTARVAQLRVQRKAENVAKRALTPYMYFIKDNFAATRASLAGASSKAVVVRLGELWRGLPEGERVKYVAMADAERRAKGLPQPARRAPAAPAAK